MTVFYMQHAEMFTSEIWKCLLAATVLESCIFYCTCLKGSQKQVLVTSHFLNA